MRLESGEKIIATGKEPSGIETPAGSSVAPVGSRTWGRGWQPSAAARAMHHAKREARDGEPVDMRGNLRAPLGAVKTPRLAAARVGPAIGLITTDPLVSRLPTDPEVAAEIRETDLVLQISGNELQAFGHLIRPGPGHRTVLLDRR